MLNLRESNQDENEKECFYFRDMLNILLRKVYKMRSKNRYIEEYPKSIMNL